MASLTLIIGLVLAGGLSFILLLFYQYWKHARYFKKRGVPYIGVGISRIFRFLSGTMSLGEAETWLYAAAKKTKGGFAGFSDSFMVPSYYITDLDLCRSIYVKDFDHFVDRRIFALPLSDLLLRKMLISLESEHWKGLRSKLTPVFSTGKFRKMFSLFEKSSEKMCLHLEEALGGNNHGEFDISKSFSKYAMDVIANCVFGVDSKSFDCKSDQFSEFEEMGQRLQFRFKPVLFIKVLLLMGVPKLANALGVEVIETFPQKYFMRVVNEVLKHRRETGLRSDDFLQLMMDTQEGLLESEENCNDTSLPEAMTDEKARIADRPALKKFEDIDIAANCVLFLIGGYDTSLSLMIFAAYQLALEQECQERVRKEVNKAMEANDGKLTYEAIYEMSYLDNFINETLRLYPPAFRTERRCTKDYKIPGTNAVIEKGAIVCMPVTPLHHDPEIYKDPKRFDPNRFLAENKKQRHTYAFAPFGYGPRGCIGLRFALIQVKIVIATLVHNFKLEPCGKTDIPVKFALNSTLKPVNGMWLRFNRIQK